MATEDKTRNFLFSTNFLRDFDRENHASKWREGIKQKERRLVPCKRWQLTEYVWNNEKHQGHTNQKEKSL